MMDKLIAVIAELKEPIAVIGLILIGMTHADVTIQGTVVGALAGIIIGKKTA